MEDAPQLCHVSLPRVTWNTQKLLLDLLYWIESQVITFTGIQIQNEMHTHWTPSGKLNDYICQYENEGQL